MKLFHTLIKSEKAEHITRRPPVEADADEVPTVILDASLFRRQLRTTEGNAQDQNSSRTHTFPQR